MQTRYLGYRSTSILRIRPADVDIYGYVAKELAKMAIKSQLLLRLRGIYFNRTTKDERFTRTTIYETTKDMTGEDDNGGRYTTEKTMEDARTESTRKTLQKKGVTDA